jgi:hypothetical protein
VLLLLGAEEEGEDIGPPFLCVLLHVELQFL